MSAVKILHCADLHIGANESFLGEKSAERRIETLMTFERIVDLAKENEVKVFLISGDLIDSNKIESSFVDRILSKIKSEKTIDFVFCAGNHDPLNYDSPFLKAEIPDNFHILPTADSVIELRGRVKIYGYSFSEVLRKSEEKFSIPPDSDTINIMCIHGEYGFDTGRNPISDKFIASSGMDYIALGHIHQRTAPQKIGNTYFCYCGCAEGLGFDELGEKGVYIGEIGKGKCELTFVPTYKRMHLAEKIDVSGLDNTAEIYEKVLSSIKEKYKENYQNNLYKIILCGEVNEETEINSSEITSRLKSETYFAKVIDETTIKINLEELKNEVSLRGIFITKMLEKAGNDTDNRDKILKALKIGLRAFSGEVTFDED